MMGSSTLLTVWLVAIPVVHLILSVAVESSKVTSEYYTSYLNITYINTDTNKLHTERTETGRFSSGVVKDVSGIAVEIVANMTKPDDNSTYELDYSGCKGPFIKNWPTNNQKWIALIKRGKCTFNTKIAHALASGASGVLVYDNVVGSGAMLQSMKVKSFPIPSVFTYNWKGRELVDSIKSYGQVSLGLEQGSHCRAEVRPLLDLNETARGYTTQITARITQNPTQVLYCTPTDAWDHLQHLLNRQSTPYLNLNLTDLDGTLVFSGERRTSVLFVSVSFIVLMLISLAWLIFYYVQRFRYIHAKDKLERKLCTQAKRALAIISTSVLKKDEIDDDTCAVCIENYRVADVVRILPCKHQFHKSCIDQWLLEKRTCPMCKMDILKHYGLIDDNNDSMEEREESMLNLA